MIVSRARVAIDLHALEAGGIWILQILNDPKAATVIKLDGDGLSNHRLGSNKSNLEAIGHRHAPGSFFGGKALSKKSARNTEGDQDCK